MAEVDTPRNSKMKLCLYTTRYSGWGARVELVLEYFGIPYEVEWRPYPGPSAPPSASSSLLPLLLPDPDKDPQFRIPDSLAICEYLADANLQSALWPRDPKLRALARSAAARMHSGFSGLRSQYHTNFVTRYTGPGLPSPPRAVAHECRDLVTLWSESRAATKERLAELEQDDQGFLFGSFSIADAFFWPVLWRFRTYQLPLAGITDDGLEWMAHMWKDHAIKKIAQHYFRQAEDPTTTIAKYDDLFRDVPGVKCDRFPLDWTFEPPPPPAAP